MNFIIYFKSTEFEKGKANETMSWENDNEEKQRQGMKLRWDKLS